MTKADKNHDIQLQILICTCGNEGIVRVASGQHPKVIGVEYIVSWQTKEENALPETLQREDFIVYRSYTNGLSINRNIALSKATAPIVLISDDDADYTTEGLNTVINAFRENPNTDIIAFEYASSTQQKHYPTKSFSLAHPPKGYFVSSIEIAMRRESVQGKIWFNENFGIGAPFPSGEEDIFLKDCLDNGLNGIFIPKTIVRHDGTTTSERNLMSSSRPQTKGAVFLRLHPNDWLLRMIAHAIREYPLWRKCIVPSPFSYCINWIKGVSKARRLKAFPTPNYSTEYSCDE